MAKLRVIVAPDSRLKKKSVKVEAVDDGIRRLMDDMLESMYGENGIGLAAPQVGELKRVVVIDIDHTRNGGEPLRMVNPEIIELSEEDAAYEEGCLSLPEHYSEVSRPASVTVRFLDDKGEEREIEAEGLLATCIQHEIDHLDGVLFVDRISSIKRNVILRKLAKAKKAKRREGEDRAAA